MVKQWFQRSKLEVKKRKEKKDQNLKSLYDMIHVVGALKAWETRHD